LKTKTTLLTIFVCPILIYGQIWDYPVKPGTEEWKKFNSIDDMYLSCQIPDSILYRLSTKDLVDICLNFPALPQFPFFNTPQECFMSYYNNFNGIRELFNRKNAGQYLLKKYTQVSSADYNPQWPLYKQGKFISYYKFVESVLAQTQIIQLMSPEERKLLMKEAVHKMEEKLTNSSLFSDYNVEINLWAMAKLLSSDNKLFVSSKEAKDMQSFLDSGLPVNIDIKTIYEQAKKYAYEDNNK